jgi:hypothetical protein
MYDDILFGAFILMAVKTPNIARTDETLLPPAASMFSLEPTAKKFRGHSIVPRGIAECQLGRARFGE